MHLWIILPFALLTNSHIIPRSNVTHTPSLSGTPITIASGTYPRANFLSDSSILLAYTATINGSHQLTLTKSSDYGTTWSQIGTAATRNATTSDLDNPYPLQLPSSGRILLAYRNHDVVDGSAIYFRITISYSDDDGVNWKFLSTPVENEACDGYKCGIWEPFLRISNSGALQLYYSKENADDDQDGLLRISEDGGLTWSDATTISGAEVTARDGMIGVADIDGNGKLIAVFETTEDGTFAIDRVVSEDDGMSWGNRSRVYTPTGDGNNAGAPQVVNVGGRLVVSFMTDEDTQEHDWIEGAGAKLVVSEDGGESWGGKIEVFEPQANWPGLLRLDNERLLYLVDYGGVKAQVVGFS